MASSTKPTSTRRLIRIAAAALLLTGVFMYVRFPYDRLIPATQIAFEEATGLPLRITEISAWPSLLGPGIAAAGLRVNFPEGERLELDEVRLRPAWNLSWLQGKPSLMVQVEDSLIRGSTLLGLGDAFSLSGELQDVDLSGIPGPLLAKGVALSGSSDVDFEIEVTESGAAGELQLSARQGSMEHPQLPMALPFESIEGKLELGGEHWLTVHSLQIESPLLAGGLAGSVGPPPGSALDLRGEFQTQREVRPILNSSGFKVNRSGTLSLAIRGNAARPLIR